MKKMEPTRIRAELRKMKRRSWFRPISCLLLVVIIILLIFGSATVAKKSAQKHTSYYSYNMEEVSSGDENAYEFYEDANTLGNTKNKLAVTLGNIYDKITGNTDREVEVAGDGENSDFYQGDAGLLEQMEIRIRESVLSETKKNYGEVVDGATGKNGEQGIKGEKGEKGEKGTVGAVGKTGAAGQSGSVGATGAKGEDGQAGMDGLSTFIAYADNASGSNMGSVPKETSKYIGTYQGTVRSSDPKDYTWTEYKDKIITYENDGKPTLKVFN